MAGCSWTLTLSLRLTTWSDMPRFRNTETGVVVDVSEEQAKNLTGYEPVDAAKKGSAKKETSSKSEK